MSWSNVVSFRLERQWLSDSKRKDPNITALKSKSGDCTPRFSPHHPRVRCRVLIQAKIPTFHSIHPYTSQYFIHGQNLNEFSHHLKGRAAFRFLGKTVYSCCSSFILGHGNQPTISNQIIRSSQHIFTKYHRPPRSLFQLGQIDLWLMWAMRKDLSHERPTIFQKPHTPTFPANQQSISMNNTEGCPHSLICKNQKHKHILFR